MILQFKSFNAVQLINEIKSQPLNQQINILSLILSSFSAEYFLIQFLDLAIDEKILNQVSENLLSNDFRTAQESVIFLKILILFEQYAIQILPPLNSQICDILSCIPPTWLINIEEGTTLDNYERDASNRINLFPKRIEGKNLSIFENLITLFEKYMQLDLTFILSLTQLISFFLAAAPDLLSDRLASAFNNLIHNFYDITSFEIPKDLSIDTNEFRAFLLTEFGKEFFSTFKASERMKNLQSDL